MKSFDNLRVAHKLWGTVLALLIAMLALSVWSQMRFMRVAGDALAAVERFENRITTAVTWRGLAELAISLSSGSIVTTDAALSKEYDDTVAGLTARITPVQEQINKTAVSPQDKEALAKVAQTRADIRGLGEKNAQIKASGDAAVKRAYIEQEYRPRGAAYLGSIDAYVKVQEQQRDAAIAAANDMQRQVMMVALASVVLVFLIGLAVTAYLVRSITRPLARVVSVTEAIAAGDLTQDIQDPRRDEFGKLLQSTSAMNARLRQLVTEVRSGVDSVSNASIEIANGNQDLSARTEQTASNLQQTAASMEQLTSTVTQSSDTARQASQLAATAAQAATRGGDVVGQVISSMQNISEASRKIADIISTIDGIAFQTNILALNAAVEAARAGEQGRGFAVVAGEVRTLAQRSAQAAKEIKTLIGASVETVESGSQQVELAGQTMTEIVSSVRRVSDLIGEISASSVEQRDGIGQVNQAVSNLDQMTQQNAALVEESAAAAAGLRDQAQRLAELVAVFNVGDQGLVAALPARRDAPRAAAIATAAKPAAVRAEAKAVPADGVKATARPSLAAPTANAAKAAKAVTTAAVAKPAQSAKPSAAPAKATATASEEGDWESF